MRWLLSLLFLASTAAAADDFPVLIALYGDSTHAGRDGGTRQVATITPAQGLQRAMDARFGPGRVLVLDRAENGTTSADLPSMPEGDIAVVNFGINDARLAVPLDAYRANLRRLHRTGVVFRTPNPVHSQSHTSDAHAQAMREVARELGAPVIDTHAHVLGLPDWRRLVPDGTHPTVELYALTAADSMRILAPLVERRLAARLALH